MAGRPAMSDAEKAAKGVYAPKGFTEEARTARKLAKVHAFPVFREIPEPTFPLGDVARNTYDTWCRRLFDTGHLTVMAQEWVMSLSIADQISADLMRAGKAVPVAVVHQRNKALAELKYLDADQSLVPQQPKNNRFARNGFPSRLR